MKIGNVECGNIILAPMAGITDMPFRALCREQGATFSYTEMISAKALYYKNKNRSNYFKNYFFLISLQMILPGLLI